MKRYGFLTFLTVMILGSIVHASVYPERNCVSIHIKDAMELNKARKPLYQKYSNYRSTEITERLLKMERKLLVGAPFADLWARLYQRKGIPIMCKDFIDMSETPAFTSMNPEGVDSILNYRKPAVAAVVAKLKQLFKERAYVEMAHFADNEILKIEDHPRYNCLYRHMLESIRRMAILTPEYMEMAQSLGFTSPELLSRNVLRSHFSLLEESALIDQLAAPLQAQGLPIICQDVPYIPWP